MKDWIYTQPHDPMLLTMHDCIVTRIELEESEEETRMVWYLPDGIWITPEIPCHEIKEMCRTAETRAVFSSKYMYYRDDLSVSISRKCRWHGKNKNLFTETRACMTLQEFVDKFRTEGWSLEIVNTYTEGKLFLIEGEIHTARKRQAFKMSFNADNADFFWNDIHPDRMW